MGKKEILIIGAGISGVTAARKLAENGYCVKILEQRKTIGGNLYDETDENGIIIQKYGPHIFHTDIKEVYDFLSRFTEWEHYEHKVLGYIDGKYVPVPFNLTTLFELYNKEEAEKIKNILINEIGLDKKVPVLQLKNHPDATIRQFAQFVYEKIFYTYTHKQWGFDPEELGDAVGRVPVYISYEDRYFTDKYQYQPVNGFTPLINSMLNHPSISLETSVNALDKLNIKEGKIYFDGNEYGGKVIYTGRIDELFKNKFGALPYRSLNFVLETHNTPSYQPAAVVNYTVSEDYTRISEFTKFTCKQKDTTVIMKEYSKLCGEGDIPYYPIPKADYLAEYAKYLKEAESVENLYLLGRLACYKYINIDVAVNNAIALAESIIKTDENKIKIAELLDAYYPCIDGPINVVTNYSKNLDKKASCKLLVPRAQKKLKYKDSQPFEVIRCASTSAPEGYRLGHPASDRNFKKKFKAEKFDILHTHSPFSMGMFAIRQGKKLKIPVVATLHTKYYDDFSRVLHGFKPLCNFMLWNIMRVYKRADSVWTVNNASKQVLRDYGYKGEIEVVRNGTDLKYPENAKELIAKVNKLHNLEGQKNVFIFVGRIAMYKNLKLMTEALKILKDDGCNFKMLVIGSGFDENKLKKMVADFNLTDRFIFTGSVSDRQLLQGYYLRSDLFLFPSTFDTSSLVPIEAAAHKLPTLLIKGCCTAENIVDGVNGFLSEETSEAYAEKIKEIISNPALLKNVGEGANKMIYRSWEMVADEVLQKYNSIIQDYNTLHNK